MGGSRPSITRILRASAVLHALYTAKTGPERCLSTTELIPAFALEGIWQLADRDAQFNLRPPLQSLRLLAEDVHLETKPGNEGDPNQSEASE
jgi:hypothetical protein